jgi:hypothetical protein
MALQSSPLGKLLLASALSAALLLPGAALVHAADAPVQAATDDISSSEYAVFLQDKFGISLNGIPTKGEFLSDLAQALDLQSPEEAFVFNDLAQGSPYYDAAQALAGQGILTSETVNASEPLDAVNAVQIALKAAGLKELAYTYPQDKIDRAFANLPIDPVLLGRQGAQEVAAAVDTGLVPSSYYAELAPGSQASADLAAVLIGKVLSFKGQYKHYIGYVSDPDIYAKLTDAFETSDIIHADELQKIVDAALEQNLVTGYNLKDARFDSNFVPSLSLVYGHSDLTHALQLIGLLRSEGIDAKVQFEPKTSAFVYLKEWGEPAPSDLYEVRQIANGNYIEYAKEYDIAFEFFTAEDKARFDAIVSDYAKKNEEDQEGLLYGSWWQPLYYSLTELPNYKLITNNKIENGHYYAQSFSLKEQSQSVADGFRSIDPSVSVVQYDFWTDVPFFNYLNGESL